MPDNPDTLVAVHCYKGDREQVVYTLPKYQHHGCPVLVLSPDDSRVKLAGVRNKSAGQAGWKGLHTIERQIAHLRILADHPERYFLLHDADSVCLAEDLPRYLYDPANEHIFWSNEGCDSVIRKLRGEWTAQDELNQTLQPPYFFSRDVLHKVLEVAEVALSLAHAESGIDQFYAEAVKQAGLERRPYPDGIHRETRHLNELARVYYMARVYGTCMIHSVKTAEALETLVTGIWEHDNGPEWGPGR